MASPVVVTLLLALSWAACPKGSGEMLGWCFVS